MITTSSNKTPGNNFPFILTNYKGKHKIVRIDNIQQIYTDTDGDTVIEQISAPKVYVSESIEAIYKILEERYK